MHQLLFLFILDFKIFYVFFNDGFTYGGSGSAIFLNNFNNVGVFNIP